MTPRLLVTCGDVNGIGIECFIEAMRTSTCDATIELVVNPSTLAHYLTSINSTATVVGDQLHIGTTSVGIIPIDVQTPVDLGRLSSSSGAHAIAALEYAASAVANGDADGVVTLPINKEACALAGFQFPGHTEFFGERWGGAPLMMLMHDAVRVALATVHVPLRLVPTRITVDHISERIIALARSLTTDFAIAAPRIAVLGLNPHAGESGQIGTDEDDVIEPAIAHASAELDGSAIIDGPFPADGFFGFGAYRQYDGILAMYHDQGLIPLKLLAHGGGVNVTTGLRHVRTSPDHGTAFDIVGKGQADPSSTVAAITTASEIVVNRR